MAYPEAILDETEMHLLLIIRSYNLLQWSRHYRKFDEHNLMARLQETIRSAIERGKLPPDLNLCHFVSPRMFLSHQPIPRPNLEAHISAVAEYLQERATNPAPVRYKEHTRRLKEELGLA